MALFCPDKDSPFVEKLLNLMNSEFEPEQVPVKIENYATWNNCFKNVDEKVNRDGGKPHYGWVIFQSDFICEAIRHAVWESDHENLIDITPREIEIDNILFVSDNDFVYTGQLIDNVRINITNNPLVDDFIKICETLEKFYTYGNRIGDYEMSVPEPAQTFVMQYENLKLLFLNYLSQGATSKSQCFCGQNKAYRNCHGKSIRARLINDLLDVAKQLGKKPLI